MFGKTSLRIPIRAQLTALVLISTLLPLAVLAVATWVSQRNFTINTVASKLTLTASLKATELETVLMVFVNTAKNLATRIRFQEVLATYNNGTTTADDWDVAILDMKSALLGSAVVILAVQAHLLPTNGSDDGWKYNLVNFTTSGLVISDEALLNIPSLFPNLTYSFASDQEPVATFAGRTLGANSSTLLGPLQYAPAEALVSITVPVQDDNNTSSILGYLTVVMQRGQVSTPRDSSGLGDSGLALIIVPNMPDARFPTGFPYAGAPSSFPPDRIDSAMLRFPITPPRPASGQQRHLLRAYGTPNPPFTLGSYQAVLNGYTQTQHTMNNNAGSEISTYNEEGYHVSVGFALANISLCDCMMLVELDQNEVWAPIRELRKILLACTFGTAAAMVLLILPIAGVASRPITRLRNAAKATTPRQSHSYSLGAVSGMSSHSLMLQTDHEKSRTNTLANINWMKPSTGSHRMSNLFSHLRKSLPFVGTRDDTSMKNQSRQWLPRKVRLRKTFIKDEITDLIETFNEMTEQIADQYWLLEERVKQRTAELEISKKAAEAANESKSLFIANISHELKTPLNGVLGMCTLCLQELHDPIKIKHSLEIALKSGELLNHLLTDLLMFTKSSGKHQLVLEKKDFPLREIKTQLHAIFDTQVHHRGVPLQITYGGTPSPQMADFNGLASLEPIGTSEDFIVYGDQQRILQVLINLLSNALKFTVHGYVRMTIRAYRKHPHVQNLDRPSFSREKSTSDPTRGFSSEKTSPASATFTSSQSLESPVRSSFGIEYWFEFEVQDTGPGIPLNLQAQIFEPFVQGDLRLTKQFGGTGLGLSICSHLARLMGGRIMLQSEVGQGSTFTLKIPLLVTSNDRRPSVANTVMSHSSRRSSLMRGSIAIPLKPISSGVETASLPEMEESAGEFKSSESADIIILDNVKRPRLIGYSQPYFSTEDAPFVCSEDIHTGSRRKESQENNDISRSRMLVAEDNSVNQEVILRMLKLEKIKSIVLARDGREAVERVQESINTDTPYALIFMDVQMPIMDGRESARRIRDIGYEGPIIALSAFSDDTNRQACLESGMNAFLSKPIKRSALKDILGEYWPDEFSLARSRSQSKGAKYEEETGSLALKQSAPSTGSQGVIVKKPRWDDVEESPHGTHRKSLNMHAE